jgi:hypothetical protein
LLKGESLLVSIQFVGGALKLFINIFEGLGPCGKVNPFQKQEKSSPKRSLGNPSPDSNKPSRGIEIILICEWCSSR